MIKQFRYSAVQIRRCLRSEKNNHSLKVVGLTPAADRNSAKDSFASHRACSHPANGEGGPDYAGASSGKILFLNVAFPDDVFKYFSRRRAVPSDLTAT